MAVFSFLVEMDNKSFSFLTPVIWIVIAHDSYYEISDKNRGLYFFSLICSQKGDSICVWPFQGSAVWLDGCLCYHLLQPLLHVRNQGDLGSQSNTEYWKGYNTAADHTLLLITTVINIQEPRCNDKDCNKNRWGQGVNFYPFDNDQIGNWRSASPFSSYCTAGL
jgi:hypothetical protein